jgi:hypothetical protein
MKNIIYVVAVLMSFYIESSFALPACKFFSQNEITSSYVASTPNSLKNINFINIEKGVDPYNTLIFDDNCKILYKRELEDIPIAIFPLDGSSNIVFITKGRGSAYAVDAYLIGESSVIPVVADLTSKNYPLFNNLKNQIPADIISCVDVCSAYKFNKKIGRYMKQMR